MIFKRLNRLSLIIVNNILDQDIFQTKSYDATYGLDVRRFFCSMGLTARVSLRRSLQNYMEMVEVHFTMLIVNNTCNNNNIYYIISIFVKNINLVSDFSFFMCTVNGFYIHQKNTSIKYPWGRFPFQY